MKRNNSEWDDWKAWKKGWRYKGDAPTDPEYGSVFRFVERGYKKDFTGLPKYMQEELINAFPDVKFDFTRNSKYGVPAS